MQQAESEEVARLKSIIKKLQAGMAVDLTEAIVDDGNIIKIVC